MHKDILQIPFSINVNTITFEQLLKYYYINSKQKSISEVVFDFKQVEWCETFQISLLALWISELLSKGKRVVFVPPSPDPLPGEGTSSQDERSEKVGKRIAVYSYLVHCLFINFLQEKKVISENDLEGHRAERRPKSIESRISPLIFFSIATDFQNLMQRIRDYRQYKRQFDPVWNLDVVKSGEVRDIILKELGDNIFDHANGRFGHLIMTFRSPIEANDQEALLAREILINSAPAFERQFFYNLGESGYLSVIISDKGPGIWKTLRKEYDRDDRIKSIKKPKPTEYDIIDYAFLQHSTCKNREERLGSLQSLIEKLELNDAIPATGLFWVKEVVKAYNGLLLVRSGCSLVCYDFLNYPDYGHPKESLITNKIDKRMKSLEDFGGTQIRIYFPTHTTVTKRKVFFISTEAPDPDFKRKYEYFSLSTTPFQSVYKEGRELGNWLADQIDYIQKIKHSPGGAKTIVVDCEGWEYIEEKALKAFFLLIVELMRMQDRNFSSVIVNGKGVLERIVSSLTQVVTTTSGIPKEKPILAFDENFTLSVYELSEHELGLFEDLLHSLREGKFIVDTVPGESFLKKIEHLITFDPSTNKYTPLFSLSEVKNGTREGLRKKLESVILDPENKIYHPSGCFLIPSGAYSEGYFELHRLLKEEVWRWNIVNWLRYGIENLRPNNLVTLGRGPKTLGELIVKDLRRLNHINIGDPRNPAESLKLALLAKNDKTVILTDVIGTQRSLNTVLNFCTTLDIQTIYALVDAREGNIETIKFNGQTYPLESIVRRPIKFWFEEKPVHYRYEDITRIDPISNAPITEHFLFEQPIWKNMDEKTGENQFLNQILGEINGIVIGHFESNERHILYLFLTSAIAKEYGSTIADVIRNDVQMYKERELGSEKITISYIYYPQHTPGADEIARQISLVLGGGQVVSLTRREIKYPLSYEKLERNLETVIIFDDASATGYNARQMIEFAERTGAKNIFVYILCNRADRSTSRLLQKIERYGHSRVHVRYLCELPIPTFSQADCPICEKIELLERLKVELKDLHELVPIIEEEINKLRKQPITHVLMPETVTPYISTPLDERLIQTDLRAQLELSKNLLPIRTQIAEVVKQHKTTPQKVLFLFAAIAKEEYFLLRKDPISFNEIFYDSFNEVFYDSFKKSIIKACEHFIEGMSELSEQQILDVISVFRIFDPDSLLECLDRVNKNLINKNLLLKILVQLLLSERIRQRAPYVASILRNFLANEGSSLISPIVQFWEEKARPTPRSRQVFSTYTKIYMTLSDSAHLANYFAGLEHEKFPSLDLAKIERIVKNFWKAASVLLKDEVLPALQDLANSQISRAICNELQKQIVSVNSFVYKADELAEILLTPTKKDEDKTEPRNGFHIAITGLQRLLLEDEEGAIPRSLLSFRTELCRLIRRLISQRATDFQKKGIEIEIEIPDDARIVFGHEVDIYTIVNNLLENIITRAFDGIGDGHRKVCSIKLETSPKEEIVLLQIFDSGRGLSQEFQYGVGLSTVDDICRRICDGWHIGQASEYPFKTKALVKFYAIPKD